MLFYNLCSKLMSLSMSIDVYYSTFDRLMDTLTSMVHVCTVVPWPAHQFIEKFFTYIFVMGVQPEFDSLRAWLLHDSDTSWLRCCLNYLLKRFVLSVCLLLVWVLTVCWLLFRNQGILLSLVGIANQPLTTLKNALLSFQRS
jgi:hypothetical protein